jgi:hypothetical protein
MDDNTEGALAAGEYDDEPELRVTLDVDLPWTDLSHFRQRIESELGNPKYTAGRFARRDHWLFGGEVFRFLWDDEDFIPLPRSAPPSKQLYPNVRRYVRVTPSVHGEIEVGYEMDEGILGEGCIGYLFYIEAKLYRRDRLKVRLLEYNEPPVYGPRLRRWLAEGWGDSSIVAADDRSSLSGSGAVREDEDKMPILGERITEDEWFNWFDWFYRQPVDKVGISAADMKVLSGKSISRIETMRAQYWAAGGPERGRPVGPSVRNVAGRRKRKS